MTICTFDKHYYYDGMGNAAIICSNPRFRDLDCDATSFLNQSCSLGACKVYGHTGTGSTLQMVIGKI